jgi:aminoglycoside phosphotransferase (APT) family kinase protein
MSEMKQRDRRLIASGASSRIVDLGDARILKLFHDSVSDEMIEREALAAAFAHQKGLPVAHPLGQRTEADGRRGIIYPLLDGETLMSALRTQWSKGRNLLGDMAALHRKVHERTAPEGLRSVKQVLTTDIRHGPASIALKEAVTAHLHTLPDGDQLLHGDYHVGNVMLTSAGMHIIDWAKAARGSPAADAVRTELLFRFGMGPSDPLTNMWRDWAARFHLRRYLAVSGVMEAEMAAWRPVVATAWLRARDPVRTRAFDRYLDRALRDCGLPSPVREGDASRGG